MKKFVLLLALFFTGCGSAPSADESKTVEAAPIKITSRELAKEYETDEAAARARFENNPVLVSGKIGVINENENYIGIVFDNENSNLTVTARVLKNQREAVMRLTKGNAVALLCIGGNIDANKEFVTVKDCKIQ